VDREGPESPSYRFRAEFKPEGGEAVTLAEGVLGPDDPSEVEIALGPKDLPTQGWGRMCLGAWDSEGARAKDQAYWMQPLVRSPDWPRSKRAARLQEKSEQELAIDKEHLRALGYLQ
jgi:hypothetical protein